MTMRDVVQTVMDINTVSTSDVALKSKLPKELIDDTLKESTLHMNVICDILNELGCDMIVRERNSGFEYNVESVSIRRGAAK